MKIRFLGAVDGVTGSNHLIQAGGKNIMLDCGMYQGKDEDLNAEEFVLNPAEIDCLLLSHSHIDHSGRIPLLVKKGFKGEIYCSKPTYDLCQIMLLDSAHIQETEAEWKNKRARRSGRKLVEPLYTQEDALESLNFFKPALYGQIINIDEKITVKFNDAGHILGSSIIEIWIKDGEETIKLVYSGDLGMREKPILRDPVQIDSADYLIMEATYGDRVHENIDKRTEDLINIILKTVRRGGSVIIPSFAVGRTQELIYELNKYYDSRLNEIGSKENELRKIPVYIDSPLAVKATEVFRRNSHAFDEEAKDYIMRGDNPLDFENLHFTQSAEESRLLNFSKEPKIIISASGMCEAGRIRHHLKHNLWKKEASVVFVGYQAEGTLGRRLLEGEKSVKLLGEDIAVNAEIYNIEGFSGHADKPALLNWIEGFKEKPGQVFVVHGERESKEAFAKAVRERFGIDTVIPRYNVVYDIKKKNHVDELVLETDKEEFTDKHIQELLKEVKELKKAFERALENTEEYLQLEDVNLEEIKRLNNNIKSLENEIMNLTMISAK
jgi:metallo-beta-lactamase family protein